METKKTKPTSKPTSKPVPKKTAKSVKETCESKLKLSEKSLADAQKLIQKLQLDLIEANRLNQVNTQAFQAKAKTFQDKAQIEVNKIREQLTEKMKKEISELEKYAAQNLLEGMIDPILSLDQVVNSKIDDPAINNYVQGFKMLMLQLYDGMQHHGVTRITPHVGEKFDPEIHHAISSASGPKDKIIEIKKDGFKLYDRTIRPATVIVGK